MTKKEALKEISKCKTVDEIISLAKNHNYELSKEKAEELFNKTHGNTELSENELNNVSGGCGGTTNQQPAKPDTYDLIDFPSKESVTFMFNVGDHITYCEARYYSYVTHEAVITSKNAMYSISNFKKVWHDCYDVEYKEGNGKTKKSNVYRDTFVRK